VVLGWSCKGRVGRQRASLDAGWSAVLLGQDGEWRASVEAPAMEGPEAVGCCRLLRALGCCFVGGVVVAAVERNRVSVPTAAGGSGGMVGVESLHVPSP
jgi:hypothetical protein